MKRSTLQGCLAWLLIGWAAVASGAPVPDLFAAEVPVADTTEEARDAAFSLAMAQVLTRVTGLRNAPALPEAAPILEQANAFVQQYTYRPESRLWVAFDGVALERTLLAAKLPVWNRDRPAIVVWLAVDWGGGRSLIAATDDGPVKAQVEAVARDRGLPLIWPLLDSRDLAVANATDIWGGYGDKVQAASQRYGADAVLVGRLRGGPGQRLFGTWDFQSGSDTQRWRGGLSDGPHQVADFLVSRLATSASAASMAVITVSEIADVADYGDTLNYLQRLSLVEAVRVLQIQGDTVVFELDLLGDRGRLRRAIDVGNVLRPLADDDGVALYFRYAR